MYVEDARAGYRVAPGFEGQLQRNRVRTHFVTNSLGLRDIEADDTRRPRVLAFGDSNTWGWGVKQASVWPAVVGRRLRDHYPHIQVLNCGTNGYGTANALGLLQDIGPQLAPDLVLLGFYANDFSDNLAGINAYSVKDGYLFDERSQRYWQARPLLRRSHLIRLINRVWDGIRVRWFGGLPQGRAGWNFDLDDLRKGGALSAALIIQMRDLSRQIGARFAVVWLPAPELVRSTKRKIPIRWQLRAAVSSAGIPSIDLLAPVRQLRRWRNLYIPKDSHLSAEGHAFVGRLVSQFIESEGSLLPEPVTAEVGQSRAVGR